MIARGLETVQTREPVEVSKHDGSHTGGLLGFHEQCIAWFLRAWSSGGNEHSAWTGVIRKVKCDSAVVVRIFCQAFHSMYAAKGSSQNLCPVLKCHSHRLYHDSHSVLSLESLLPKDCPCVVLLLIVVRQRLLQASAHSGCGNKTCCIYVSTFQVQATSARTDKAIIFNHTV